EDVSGTRFYREDSQHTLMAGFELITSWVPLKLTGSYTYILNQKWSLEAEVARGKLGAGALGVDLASVTEYRYSLLARRYFGNSFNFLFGLYKDDFRAKVGSEIVDDMSDTTITNIRVQLLGVGAGIGNRWQWGNGFTLGIDWFRLYLPMIDRDIDQEVLNNIDDSNDYEAVENGIDRVAKFPTFVLMGLYLGYTF
nr:hypothetical protein [Bdellovibrionales bacterium]